MTEADSGLHRVVAEREWTDGEPDTFYVSVEVDDESGVAYVVFTGSGTWLPADLVRDEVVPWVDECQRLARSLNRVSGAIDERRTDVEDERDGNA